MIDDTSRAGNAWDDLEWDIVRLVGEIEALRAMLDTLKPPVPDPKLDSFKDTFSLRRQRFNVHLCTLNIAINDKRGEILQVYSRIGRLQAEERNKKANKQEAEQHEDRYRVPE